MFGGSSASTTEHNVNLASACANVWMINGLVHVHGFQTQDQQTEREAVLPLPNEFVWSNGRVHDSVADHFWCSERRQWELGVVFSHRENCWTSVLCFTLYWRLLYEAACIFGCFVTGFCNSGCHVCPFQAWALCDETCMTKAIYKQLLQQMIS